MKHYVDACTACIMKDAKIELLTQELHQYKQELIDYDKHKYDKPRGTLPWSHKKGNTRYPPSGYD
tara:strand:- start:2060 stop:2254 length:195 start_codon:yes stop_codon:yes gene_type:complete